MKKHLFEQFWSGNEGDKKQSLSKRASALGLALDELTPSVRFALEGLFEQLDDTQAELRRMSAEMTELERLVDVDYLAPIPNRRAFMRRLNWALTMHERYGHPSTILYFDINNFKYINDNYGHDAGDQAIRHISLCLSSAMRDSDFLARIGGDEFAVIMYYADAEAAQRRGAFITQKLAETPLMINGQSIVITSAYGYYELQGGDDVRSSLAAADMSMYSHKRSQKEASA